ncbi:MAG: dihydroneopterin aldolase [Acidimicrobiia bacterium]|nr:dihydroneopterin aldolase [Acidimicrobiia bacterium]
MDRIVITGLEVFAHHGVLAHEKTTGQRFLVDLTIHTDTRDAADGDDLTKTVDYGAIADEVSELVSSTRFDLIETVAHHVAKAVLTHTRVSAVDVTIHKPEAPVDHSFGDVAVTISRSNQHGDRD